MKQKDKYGESPLTLLAQKKPFTNVDFELFKAICKNTDGHNIGNAVMYGLGSGDEQLLDYVLNSKRAGWINSMLNHSYITKYMAVNYLAYEEFDFLTDSSKLLEAIFYEIKDELAEKLKSDFKEHLKKNNVKEEEKDKEFIEYCKALPIKKFLDLGFQQFAIVGALLKEKGKYYSYDESSMRALSATQKGVIAKAQEVYKEEYDTLGEEEVIESFKKYCKKKFLQEQDKKQENERLKWDTTLNEFNTLSADVQQLYLRNPYHSAYRYLAKPNPLMHPQAESVGSYGPNNENRYALIKKEDRTALAHLWLAAKDDSYKFADVSAWERWTHEAVRETFTFQVAEINRQHNRDDRPDDYKELDRPSCNLGVTQNLSSAVMGNTKIGAHKASKKIEAETVKNRCLDWMLESLSQWLKENPSHVYALKEGFKALFYARESNSSLEQVLEEFKVYLRMNYPAWEKEQVNHFGAEFTKIHKNRAKQIRTDNKYSKSYSEIAKTYLDNVYETGFTARAQNIIGDETQGFYKNLSAQNKLIGAIISGEGSDVIGPLLKQEAKLDIKDNQGNNLLMLAMKYGNTEGFKTILSNMKDEKLLAELLKQQNKYGTTPLMWAVKLGKTNIVKAILAMEDKKLLAELFKQQNKRDNTPLMWAVKLGKTNIVKDILAMEDKKLLAELLKQQNKSGNTPLMWAIHQGHLDTVKTILMLPDKALSLELLNHKNQSGETVFSVSQHNNRPEITKYLEKMKIALMINNADLPDKSWWSNPKRDAFIKLAEQIDPYEIGLYGMPLLVQAAYQKRDNIARCLLAIQNINVNAKTKYGRTALFYACNHGNLSLAATLLNCGADLFTGDKAGQTPLFMAMRRGHSKVVEHLLGEAQSKGKLNQIFQVNNNQCDFPLHNAATDKKLDILKSLIEAGSDLKGFDNALNKALESAAENNQFKSVEYLFDKGAQISNSFNSDNLSKEMKSFISKGETLEAKRTKIK